jgi:hypothetical protein
VIPYLAASLPEPIIIPLSLGDQRMIFDVETEAFKTAVSADCLPALMGYTL